METIGAAKNESEFTPKLYFNRAEITVKDMPMLQGFPCILIQKNVYIMQPHIRNIAVLLENLWRTL
jgi:hypothetical protein